jgi:hypothetical protein
MPNANTSTNSRFTRFSDRPAGEGSLVNSFGAFAVVSLLDFFTIAGCAVPFALSSDPRGVLAQNCQPTHVGNGTEQY